MLGSPPWPPSPSRSSSSGAGNSPGRWLLPCHERPRYPPGAGPCVAAYDHAQITGIAAAHVGYELLSALAAGKSAP
jgi:hypothetical protein